MTRHLHRVFLGEAEPETTVEQAFLAELMGYAAVRSTEGHGIVEPRKLLPDDLANIYEKQVY
jgi:hypothetical protein